ncbi:MAG: LruC domain-containing protein [Duncaniella sp.]|nr:LruC domain-containing protein [Duncaniella sp.]
MHTLIRRFLILTLLAFTVTGCVDDSLWQDERWIYGELKPAKDYFSFNTVDEVLIDIDYGKSACRALIAISVDDPSYTGPDGETLYDDEKAVFKVFLDENGRFNGRVAIPTYSNNIYIHATRPGLSPIVITPIKNREATAYVADYAANDADDNGGDSGSLSGVYPPGYSPEAQAEDERLGRFAVFADNNGYKIWEAPRNNWGNSDSKLYTIMNWTGQRFARVVETDYTKNFENQYFNNQGLIDDLSGLEHDKDDLDLGDIDVIQRFLWAGNSTKPDPAVDNSKYQTTTSGINTVIPYEYVNDEGVTMTVTGAHVWIRFLAEGARYMNSVGYYYYPTDNPPEDVSQIRRFIAIPNASLLGSGKEGQPFRGVDVPDVGFSDAGYCGYDRKFIPFAINQRVKLLYYDEATGEISDLFPPGYTIGYFISPKEGRDKNVVSRDNNYPTSNPLNTTMTIESGFKYSNTAFNPTTDNDKRHRFIALNYKDYLIYGLEDSSPGNGGDYSYDDIIFAIETDPEGIANNEDYYTINDDGNGAMSEYRTYAFEDIWPDGGDYDLNDVVVDHHRRITFTPENYVTAIADTFRIMQPDNAATYRDAFAINLPNTSYNSIKLFVDDSQTDVFQSHYEEGTNSLIFSRNTMADVNRKFIMLRTFDDKVLKLTEAVLDQKDADGVVRNILNPFIVSQYKDGDQKRIEIHLPKHEATPYADGDLIGTKDDAFYVNKDGLHPFALSIPRGIRSGPKPHYILKRAEEGFKYGEVIYPDFYKWVVDKNNNYSDWYLYYRTSKDSR